MTTMLAEGLPHTALRDIRDDISPTAYKLAEALVAAAKKTILDRGTETPRALHDLIHSFAGAHLGLGELSHTLSEEDTEALDLLNELLSSIIHTCRVQSSDAVPGNAVVLMEEEAFPGSRVYYLAESAFKAQGWTFAVGADTEGGWIWAIRFSLR